MVQGLVRRESERLKRLQQPNNKNRRKRSRARLPGYHRMGNICFIKCLIHIERAGDRERETERRGKNSQNTLQQHPSQAEGKATGHTIITKKANGTIVLNLCWHTYTHTHVVTHGPVGWTLDLRNFESFSVNILRFCHSSRI